MHPAAPPSNLILAPPLTTASTPLQWGQYNADEKEKSPHFASPYKEQGWHVHLVYPPSPPTFSTGVTLLPLLAATTSLSVSLLVASAPPLSSLCLSSAVVVCKMLLDDFVQTNLIWLSQCTLYIEGSLATVQDALFLIPHIMTFFYLFLCVCFCKYVSSISQCTAFVQVYKDIQ